MFSHRRSSRFSSLPAESDHGHGPSTLGMHRCQCHFSGRVQGVGFRYTVKNIALQHNIAGYVKNLRDGRVELVMEGPDEEMNQVIDSVKSRMTGYIRGLEQSVLPATGEFEQFQIRH